MGASHEAPITKQKTYVLLTYLPIAIATYYFPFTFHSMIPPLWPFWS